MNSFTFLNSKYFKTSHGVTVDGTTTTLTSVGHHSSSTDGDNGPFLDLEFTAPEEDKRDEKANHEAVECTDCTEGEDVDDDSESDGTSDSENERDELFTFPEPTVSHSTCDDLSFHASESNEKLQFAPLKSSTKFRILILKLKKPKENGAEKTEFDDSAITTANMKQRKLPRVKFQPEEVPKSEKQKSSAESVSNESPFSKVLVQRYLKTVKPMYVRVSQRYNEKKLRFSAQLTSKSSGDTRSGRSPPSNSNPTKSTVKKSRSGPREMKEPPLPVILKTRKQVNLPARLRVVCKHLGKSGSAPAAFSAVPSQENRRNDSLLEQQDGIQSAILHCKRSFNGTRDSASSILSRSASDPLPDMSLNWSEKNWSEELKETDLSDGSEP